MNKRLEEKILAEIRKRVIEKDLELQEKNEDEIIREANIEVLTELTNLSKKEVEEIAKVVRSEVKLEADKNRKKTIYLSIAASFVILIFLIIFWPEAPLKEVLVEDSFTDNTYGWDIFDKYKYKKTIQNGFYIFEPNVEGWCYWDDINIEFPENYDVYVNSLWKHGKFDSYGFTLHQNSDNYCAFQIKADGTAFYGKVVETKWVYEGSWKSKKANSSEMKKPNTQLVKVRAGNFSYYVNNNIVEEGNLGLNISGIGLRACGQQQVAFDNLKIINVDNDEIVFEESFETPSSKWAPSEKMIKQTYFENGEYIFRTNGDDCMWSISSKHIISNNCEITLSSTWLSGEMANYGLMILQDNLNYISCEFKNDGNIRLVKSENGEYTDIQDYVKTKFISNGSLKHRQKAILKNGLLEYFIDDEFVQSISLDGINPSKIGLRVCEKQTVAFDNLSITTFE
ncbi:MAG: hypothetical protein JXR51_02265 [Bacteroidales bacterium]|nr:hypothetical protein [Bacteroidales bacterium]MBN2755971.1 hypothetical protein [Bacteroidales bacterium]